MEVSQQNNEDGHGGNGSSRQQQGSSNGFLCGQSSTRWTPTTDQIRILKDLYYNNGVRSPTAEQIQRISARLRQYGKIEGKNVFYWFQNHKARERQKKRFTTSSSSTNITTTDSTHHHHLTMQRGVINPTAWKPPHHQDHHNNNNLHQYQSFNKYSPAPNNNNNNSSSTMLGAGQIGQFGYGGVNFRESGSSVVNGHNFGWVGVEPYSSTYNTLFEKRSMAFDDEEDEDEEENNIEVEYEEIHSPEIETLPLFPMHAEDINGYTNNNFKPNYYSGWFCPDDGSRGGSRASLELRLNSYSRGSPDLIN